MLESTGAHDSGEDGTTRFIGFKGPFESMDMMGYSFKDPKFRDKGRNNWSGQPGKRSKQYCWETPVPIVVRAMVLAGGGRKGKNVGGSSTPA